MSHNFEAENILALIKANMRILRGREFTYDVVTSRDLVTVCTFTIKNIGICAMVLAYKEKDDNAGTVIYHHVAEGGPLEPPTTDSVLLGLHQGIQAEVGKYSHTLLQPKCNVPGGLVPVEKE